MAKKCFVVDVAKGEIFKIFGKRGELYMGDFITP